MRSTRMTGVERKAVFSKLDLQSEKIQRNRKIRRAFTLIELLVVIAIIAILAAMLLAALATSGGTFSRGSLSLSWSASADGYYLEYTTNLSSGIWFSNPVAPGTISGFKVVTQSINGGNKFFRLRHP